MGSPIIKFFFLTRAAFEIGRERIEDYLDTFTAQADECKTSSTDRFEEVKHYLSGILGEFSQKVWSRSESLENEMKEKIRRQIADFSLGALGDTSEINELRAEIASLRAEIAEIKSARMVV